MAVEINLDELYLAFEAASSYLAGEVNYYLDKLTGKVLAEIDDIYYFDGSPVEKEIKKDFWAGDFSENTRYLAIPINDPVKTQAEITTDDYHDMQVFINSMKGNNIKNELQQVLDKQHNNSQKAMAHFLKMIEKIPERKQWLLFRENQQEKRAKYISEVINYRMISWLNLQGMLNDENIELL